MKETPKMPIWLLIIICILTVVIVLAVLLQILLEISIPGLIPFATAALIVPMLASYFKSPKKDRFLLTVFIVALVLNVAGGILQIIANG
jgi:amino acid transporter